MRKSRFTDSQIMDALRRVEAGRSGSVYLNRFSPIDK